MAHQRAIKLCQQFLSNYATKPGRLLDVGGEGDEYEKLVHDAGHLYFSLGVGDGVDYCVEKNPYSWDIKDFWFDYVICCSTLEHIPWFWATFKEMVRATKPGGFIFVCAPSSGPIHWDLDCWRFMPDSMNALARWGNVMPVQVFLDDGPECDKMWKDCVGVFQKP